MGIHLQIPLLMSICLVPVYKKFFKYEKSIELRKIVWYNYCVHILLHIKIYKFKNGGKRK